MSSRGGTVYRLFFFCARPGCTHVTVSKRLWCLWYSNESVSEEYSLDLFIFQEEGQLKQAPGESSSNQSKRKCPESGSLQQGASKKRASSSKASRTRLSLGKKLEVIRLLDENVAFSDITSLYGCGVSTIRKIKRERRKLELDAASCARKASSKSSRGVGIPEVCYAALRGCLAPCTPSLSFIPSRVHSRFLSASANAPKESLFIASDHA